MYRAYQDVNEPTDGGAAPGYAGHFLWLLMLGIALLVYLMTGNILYATAIPFFHAWWKPFCCGLWLRNVDPNPARGRAHFWFYLAMAFYLAAFAAIVALLCLLMAHPPNGPGPPLDQFVLTLLTVFGGVGVGSIYGIVGIALALRAKVKVWADPSMRQRCFGSFRRLAQTRLGYYYNLAFYVIAFSLVVPVLFTGTGIMMAYGLANAGANNVQRFTMFVALIFFIVGPWVMIAVSAFLSTRIVANTPAECWS